MAFYGGASSLGLPSCIVGMCASNTDLTTDFECPFTSQQFISVVATYCWQQRNHLLRDAAAWILRRLRPRTGDARHAELRVLGGVGRALGRLGRPRHLVLLV